MSEKTTYSDFAKRIKENYPYYKNFDDVELTRKMIEKFPYYADKVDTTGFNTVEPKTAFESITSPETKEKLSKDVQVFKDIGGKIGEYAKSSITEPKHLLEGTIKPIKDLAAAPGKAFIRGIMDKDYEGAEKEFREVMPSYYNDPKTKQERQAQNVGNALTKGTAAIGLSSLVPGSSPGILSKIGAFTGKSIAGSLPYVSDRIEKEGVSGGLREIGEGLAFDAATAGIGDILKFLGNNINTVGGDVLEGISGVPKESLKAYGFGASKQAKDITRHAGMSDELKDRLIKIINTYDEHLPETKIINEALQKMPDLNFDNILNKLKSKIGSGSFKGESQTLKDLKSTISRLENEVPVGLNQKLAGTNERFISALDYKDMIKRIDDEIGEMYGKTTNKYLETLKSIRHEMAENLKVAAASTGNTDYVKAMDSLAAKMKAMDDIMGYTGKSLDVQKKRGESFISNLFGRNKSEAQKALKQLDDVFGEDLFRETQLTKWATDLGIDKSTGLPKSTPMQTTGKSTLGVLLGLTGLSAPITAAPATQILEKTGEGLRSVGAGVRSGYKFPSMGNRTLRELNKE